MIFRASRVPFGIKQSDRHSHIYVIGKKGVGKSTLLESLVLGDLRAARGLALIAPHGDLVARIWAAIPQTLRREVTNLDATDPHQPFGYNPLPRVRADLIPLAVLGLLETLHKLWPDAWASAPDALSSLLRPE